MHPILRLTIFAAGALLVLDNRHKKMPAVQRRFDEFHDRIRLGEEDEKANLREKRDTLIKALRKNLASDSPSFESFHQGSYPMHTGTIPLDGDFDIDVGIVFDCTRDWYSDPVTLKRKVRDALNRNGRRVEIRRSCVTVHYAHADKATYHVDLAIYAKRSDGLLDIAKGKEHSSPEHRLWEKSDPKRLTELLSTRFKGENLQQYRRCIRFMKHWRDVQFSSGGPLSIALTVAAYRWFRPHEPIFGKSFDLSALLDWTKAMLARFEWVKTAEGNHKRLCVFLPSTPKVDLMEKMTRTQMDNFSQALIGLRNGLENAYDQSLTEDAIKLLAEQFGNEFPTICPSAERQSVGIPST